MSLSLPEYYFRVRDNGAFVFRVENDARQRRLEMDQIAIVNLNKGEVKPHGDRVLSDADTAAIEAWMDERRALLARRELDDIHRAVDFLNTTTHWLNSKATDDQVDEISDSLLLAMHDLRTLLVRRKSERLTRAD